MHNLPVQINIWPAQPTLWPMVNARQPAGRGGEYMRGKLRDKRDIKEDRLKRDLMGRRPSKRDNRNLQLHQPLNDEDEFLLEDDEEEVLVVVEEKKHK
jgi:hypothetical protein